MKKLFTLFILNFAVAFGYSQEILANVTVNYQQIQGSNTQMFKTLEKSLRDFINNTSWTGKRLQNFEKIKSNFAIVISQKTGSSNYTASMVVQASRPVFNSSYDSPLININDTNFTFEYTENENLVFNERQFSGKNLIDVVSFYVYLVLGYDADSFQMRGGQNWFEKASRISNNAQNQKFPGWSVLEGPRTRGSLIDNLLKPEQSTLRNTFYLYHRSGLDNLSNQDQLPAKQTIAQSLMQLKAYENDFALNYPLNLFIDTKKNEIYDIFNNGSNGGVSIPELKALFILLSPKDADSKWNKWK